MRHVKRFLACRRGAVALESAIAVVPLIFFLAGIFEIVQTVFVSDLLQRAAHRVAYTNALRESAASNTAELRTACLQEITTEVGDFLGFELADENGSCSSTHTNTNTAPAFCLKVRVTVYDNPSAMLNNTPSLGSNAQLGGDAGNMVVVEVVATPQRILSQLQQRFFGTNGMKAIAIRRNERATETT